MRRVISTRMMREADRAEIESGTASKELMMRAGQAVFGVCNREIPGGFHGSICIVCGSGNNAGDGYVLALILKKEGFEPEVLLLEDKFSEDGKYYYERCVLAGVRFVVPGGGLKTVPGRAGLHGPVLGAALTGDSHQGTGIPGKQRRTQRGFADICQGRT